MNEDISALDEWFEVASERLLEKFERRLEARLQRLEALTQAMMTLVGDPLDALIARVRELPAGPPRDGDDLLADFAKAINALWDEAKEREAMLQDLAVKVDELTEVIVG